MWIWIWIWQILLNLCGINSLLCSQPGSAKKERIKREKEKFRQFKLKIWSTGTRARILSRSYLCVKWNSNVPPGQLKRIKASPLTLSNIRPTHSTASSQTRPCAGKYLTHKQVPIVLSQVELAQLNKTTTSNVLRKILFRFATFKV